MTTNYNIMDLSSQIFWDTKKEDLQWDQNAAFIIERVLEYGNWNDWQIIKQVYNVDNIIEISRGIRYLSPKTLSFLVILSGLQKSDFRCYKHRQLNQGRWIY